MIRPVLGTVAARIAITAMNLLIIVAAGQKLGAEGLGAISLIVLGVTMILLLDHVVGGGGLIYLVPRYGVSPLLLPSYLWAVATAFVALAVQQFAPLVPEALVLHVVALAFLQSLNSIHLNILVGRERINLQNTILTIQAGVQLVGFVVLMNVDDATVMDYVQATYLAHGITVLLSGYFALAEKGFVGGGHRNVIAGLLRQGGLAQGANLLQLLNYRLAYYLIDRFRGLGALGVFSVTTQLAEGAWLVPKSIGGVLYSKVSNLVEAERQRDITVLLFKVAVLMGAACCALLLLIPDSLYTWIFGPEIVGLRPLIALMVPGLLAMSGSQILSHFLSGTGRIRHNTIGSGIGLLVTLPLGFWLIPGFGLKGAAITTSIAYSASVLYQLIIFLRCTGTTVLELVPHAGDGERTVQVWKKIRSRLARV